eukprot:Platyproteum_vivax@DN7043_c0_g1_i4.p1
MADNSSSSSYAALSAARPNSFFSKLPTLNPCSCFCVSVVVFVLFSVILFGFALLPSGPVLAPPCRQAAYSGYFDDSLYIFGGGGERAELHDLWVFKDTASVAGEHLPPAAWASGSANVDTVDATMLRELGCFAFKKSPMGAIGRGSDARREGEITKEANDMKEATHPMHRAGSACGWIGHSADAGSNETDNEDSFIVWEGRTPNGSMAEGPWRLNFNTYDLTAANALGEAPSERQGSCSTTHKWHSATHLTPEDSLAKLATPIPLSPTAQLVMQVAINSYSGEGFQYLNETFNMHLQYIQSDNPYLPSVPPRPASYSNLMSSTLRSTPTGTVDLNGVHVWSMVIFGGDGILLDSLWELRIFRFPKCVWRHTESECHRHMYIWNELKTEHGPQPRKDHACSTNSMGKLFVFGGQTNDSAYLNDLWELGLSQLIWKEAYPAIELSRTNNLQPSPRILSSLSAASSPDQLFLFGGADRLSMMNDLWLFHPTSAVWTRITPVQCGGRQGYWMIGV